jgi:DNA-binding response OmpR family regulator
LRRAASGPSDVCRFGTVEVDFSRGSARRAGNPVDLTPLEFKVLSALVRSQGRFLSREQLIEKVWGNGVAISDRVVDNHIMNLRRKLEDISTAPRFLVNVRGLGYRFENPDENLTTS